MSSEDGSSDDDGGPIEFNQMGVLSKAASSIGIVYAYCNGVSMTGTGFRVGSCYFATAKHVIEHCLTSQGDLHAGSRVSACFHNEAGSGNAYRYLFESVRLVPSGNDNFNFDIAILKFGDRDLRSLPEPIDVATTVDYESRVHIIGYPSSGCDTRDPEKIFDPNCKLFRPDDYKPWEKHPLLDYEHAKRSDHLLFYDCWVLHGASGAPVLQCREGRCVAVALHVQGFPEQHYWNRSQFRSHEEANQFDKEKGKEYRIFEAGLRMSSVLSAMSKQMRADVKP